MSKALRIQKKRRRQNKTDYKARLILLKSGATRIVVRRTNKYMLLQAVESKEAQDKVLCTVNSKQLLENGWDKKLAGSLKSIPASYLTGLLMAKKLDKNTRYILDMGMARNMAGSRIYAAVKGIVDGGIDLKVNKKIFPSDERLLGAHMDAKFKDMVLKVKEKLK